VSKQNDEKIFADFEADKKALARFQLDLAGIRRSLEQSSGLYNRTIYLWADPRRKKASACLQGFRGTLVRADGDGRVPRTVVREWRRIVQALTEIELVIAKFENVRQEAGRLEQAWVECTRAMANLLAQQPRRPSGMIKSGRPRIWTGVEGLYLVQAVEEKRKNKKCSLAEAISWSINNDPRLSRFKSKSLRTFEARYQDAFKYWSRDWHEEEKVWDRYRIALDRFVAALGQWNVAHMSVDVANETLVDAREAFAAAFKRWKAGLQTVNSAA
jgi:hypothetical protein